MVNMPGPIFREMCFISLETLSSAANGGQKSFAQELKKDSGHTKKIQFCDALFVRR
jgi:hypothetical protein